MGGGRVGAAISGVGLMTGILIALGCATPASAQLLVNMDTDSNCTAILDTGGTTVYPLSGRFSLHRESIYTDLRDLNL